MGGEWSDLELAPGLTPRCVFWTPLVPTKTKGSTNLFGITPFYPTVINPRRACAARVTVVGLCVCLSTTILALQAAKRRMSDTNSFSATRA